MPASTLGLIQPATSILSLTQPATSAGHRLPGQACNNYTGYCDAHHNCISADPEKVQQKLKSLFAPTAKDKFKQNLTRGMYSFIAILLFMIISVYLLRMHRRNYNAITRSSLRSRALNLLADAEHELECMKDRELMINNAYEYMLNEIEYTSNVDIIKTCSYLFPTVTTEIVYSLVEECVDELSVITRLVSLGYPMKQNEEHATLNELETLNYSTEPTNCPADNEPCSSKAMSSHLTV